MCVRLTVPPEMSGTEGCIATLLTPSWRASPGELHKLLFKPIWNAVREKKRLESFRQLCAQSPACTVTLLVALRRMKLAHCNKVVRTFSKSMGLRTCRPHWKIFASYVPNPVHARLLFRLPWGGWILPTTTKPLKHCLRVCVQRHALHITCTVVAIFFTWMGYTCRYFTLREVDYLIKHQPICERVTTSL